MSVLGVWEIYIKEVDVEGRRALVSWNGNEPKWVGVRYFESATIRKSPPEWISRGWGDGEICYICQATKDKGHREDCTHPKAKKPKVTREER
jgi:hypothetical protein